MLVSLCDICKKKVDAGEEISAGYGIIVATKTFCKKCARPVVVFLDKHGFGKDNREKK